MHIIGNHPLCGTMHVHGSKNSALPLVSVALLANCKNNILYNYPIYGDPVSMLDIVDSIGVQSLRTVEHVTLDTSSFGMISHSTDKIRGSITLLAAILSLHGKAEIKLPGGCNIGKRPVDIHIKALSALGADITLNGDIISGSVNKLSGNRIVIDNFSVGATQTAIIGATRAVGESIIINAAQEPEIIVMCNALIDMGAIIEGHGTHVIKIQGVQSLKPVQATVPSDRIQTATFILIGCLINGSKITIKHPSKNVGFLLKELGKIDGINIEHQKDAIQKDTMIVSRNLDDIDYDMCLSTFYYPGFPTDIQPQTTVFATTLRGAHSITETIFENRFIYTKELEKMGGQFNIQERTISFHGKQHLKGSNNLVAHDLRGGIATVMAALVGDGMSEVRGIEHINRGHQDIFDQIQACNAKISNTNI